MFSADQSQVGAPEFLRFEPFPWSAGVSHSGILPLQCHQQMVPGRRLPVLLSPGEFGVLLLASLLRRPTFAFPKSSAAPRSVGTLILK